MSRLAGAIMNSVAEAERATAASRGEKAEAKGKAAPKAKQLARLRSRIDLDDDVEDAKQAAKEAKKQLRKKVTDAKLARKKKMRLVTKASKLPSDDLYRIALYKRVNLMNAMVSKDMAGAVTTMLGQVDTDMLEKLLKEQLEKRANLPEAGKSEASPASALAIAGDAGGVVAAPPEVAEAASEPIVDQPSPASVAGPEDPE